MQAQIAQRALLDHLTVGALTLQEGVSYVRRALGVEVPFGGAHPLMGTHNHLMRLGEAVFLEIIAPDPDVMPRRPRWFALDDPAMRARLKDSPRLISWVARVPDLRLALRGSDRAVGDAVRVKRDSLSWLISIPSDGSMPFDGAFPTLIEWPAGPHPASRMADLGCRLEQLAITHPDGERLDEMLRPILTDGRIMISPGETKQLRATINTAAGRRELV